jgi:hypothetical protein
MWASTSFLCEFQALTIIHCWYISSRCLRINSPIAKTYLASVNVCP